MKRSYRLEGQSNVGHTLQYKKVGQPCVDCVTLGMMGDKQARWAKGNTRAIQGQYKGNSSLEGNFKWKVFVLWEDQAK